MTTSISKAIKAVAKREVETAIDYQHLEQEQLSLADLYFREFRSSSLKSCREYLQGLPTECIVPFYSPEIISLVEEEYGEEIDESLYDDAVSAYWQECGHVFQKMISK